MVRTALGLMLSLLAAVALAQGVAVHASVDRDSPHVNESFTYILRAEGQVRGDPDIAPLEQLFDVLQATESTRIQIVNGQAEQVAEWIYQLMPRGPGKALIPPIEVAGEFSNAIEIDVLPAAAASDAPGDIFLEAEVQPSTAYVQAQVVYTLRLYVGTRTGRATITAPQIAGGEAIVERLGEDRQYRATRAGREFEVHERRYAIFPQEAGSLTVGPATFEAMVIPSRGFSRVQRFRSDVLEVEVQPAVPPPPSYPDAAWLPAVRIELTERWSDDPPSLAVGVPTTRALTIEAQGLLETQLPELRVPQASGVRLYADRPELERAVTPDGLIATRTERYAVLPQRAGDAEIPGVELPWFDVDEGRWEVAIIPPRPVNVAPGADAPVPAEMPAPAPEPAPPPAIEPSRFWPSLSVIFATGWIATLLLWWRSSRNDGGGSRDSAPVRRRPANRRLLRQLRAACERDDAESAREILLEWAAVRFPDTPPRSLGALADRLPPALAGEVGRLEAALYGPRSRAWDGSGLGASLAEIDSVERGRSAVSGGDDLLPLYR